MHEGPSPALSDARIATLELEFKKFQLDFESLWTAHEKLQQAVNAMKPKKART